MCINPCGEFIEEVRTFLEDMYYQQEDCTSIARSLRHGTMKIVNNELQYKSIIDGFIYRWSKGNRQWMNVGYKEYKT